MVTVASPAAARISLAGARAPAVDHDLAVAGVERGDRALARQRAQHLGPRRRAEHHPVCAAVEPGGRAGRVADAAADAAWGEIDQLLDQGGIRALTERGIEIDHRDFADQAKAPGERARIARIQRLGLAADQLDRLAGLQVDRGDDHCRSITRVRRRIASLIAAPEARLIGAAQPFLPGGLRPRGVLRARPASSLDRLPTQSSPVVSAECGPVSLHVALIGVDRRLLQPTRVTEEPNGNRHDR
jgi:hypothetical protein